MNEFLASLSKEDSLTYELSMLYKQWGYKEYRKAKTAEQMLATLIEQGEAELCCRFCDQKQYFSREQLEKMLLKMQKKEK